ncbi:MAG: DUF3786 domain-containing protein, partial [Dehalococcoidia bacterium]
MKTKKPIVCIQKEYQHGLEIAFILANNKLASIDIEEQCKKAGASFKFEKGKKKIYLDFLGSIYVIVLPDMIISPMDTKHKKLQPREQLLLFHYLINADGSMPTEDKITYKEIKSGATYFPTFYKRSIKLLLDNFGDNPNEILHVAVELGGIKTDYGDLS